MADQNNDPSVSQDALEKALTQLNTLAKSATDEKQDLLKKAMSEDLTEEESARLIQLMGGKSEGEPLSKSVTAPLQPSAQPAVEEAVDVSAYLSAFHSGTLSAFETLSDSIEKSQNTQGEFNIAFAKAITQIGSLVKSLRDEVHSWGEKPAEQPQAARTGGQAVRQAAGTAMAKSFAGQAPAGEDQLSKAEVLSLLEEMHVDSLQKGRGGHAHCGEDLNSSIAKYEQTNRLTKALVTEIKAFRASKRGAA